MNGQQDILVVSTARRSRVIRPLVAASIPVCSATCAQSCDWEALVGGGLPASVRVLRQCVQRGVFVKQVRRCWRNGFVDECWLNSIVTTPSRGHGTRFTTRSASE